MMNLNAFNLGRKCYIDYLNKNTSTHDVTTEEQKSKITILFNLENQDCADFGGNHIVNKFEKG